MDLHQNRLRKLAVTSLILGILFIIITILIETNHIAWFDEAVISAVQGMEAGWLTSVMKFFTFLGSSIMATVLSVLAFLFLMVIMKHRRELILFVVAVAGSEIWNVILKNIIQRARPNTHRLIDITGFSFPSGHSMAAFSLYGVITFLLWRHIPSFAGRVMMIIIGIALTLLIGISRIYLGVHYPSDVLGGYLASSTWLMISIFLFEKFWKRRAGLK